MIITNVHKHCWSSVCSALCYGGDTLKTVSVTQVWAGWAGLGWAGLGWLGWGGWEPSRQAAAGVLQHHIPLLTNTCTQYSG